MSNTKDIPATGTWLAVADGAGTATITPSQAPGQWRIGAVSANGHEIGEGETESMDLEAGETLYIRGRGLWAVTAAIPIP